MSIKQVGSLIPYAYNGPLSPWITGDPIQPSFHCNPLRQERSDSHVLRRRTERCKMQFVVDLNPFAMKEVPSQTPGHTRTRELYTWKRPTQGNHVVSLICSVFDMVYRLPAVHGRSNILTTIRV